MTEVMYEVQLRMVGRRGIREEDVVDLRTSLGVPRNYK